MTPARKLMMKYKPRRYKNLLRNGDFLNGIADWSTSAYTSGEVTDKVLTCTVTRVDNAAIRIEHPVDDTIAGDTYYMCGEIFPKYTTATTYFNIGGTYSKYFYPEINTWTFLSDKLTAVNSYRFRFYHRNDNYVYGLGEQFKFKNIRLVNLSELGLEDKSKEWCDKYIAPNVDFWNFINELRNGDFRKGTDYWSGTGCNLSVDSNILQGSATGMYSGIYQFSGKAIPSNICYVRSKFRLINSDCTKVTFRLNGSTGGTDNWIPIIENPLENTWYDIGAIFAIPSDASGKIKATIMHQYIDSETALDKSIEVKYIEVINLTKIFGSGSEPTDSAWCDANIAPYINMDRWDNLIENGDFSDGTTGWGATGVIKEVNDDNEMELTVDELTWQGLYRIPERVNAVTSHKYYMANEVFPLYESQYRVQLGNSIKYLDNIIANIWNFRSTILNCISENSDISFYLTQPVHGLGEKFKMRNCMLIDLTAEFGLGNEPSKEWCNKYLADYINY